MKTAHTALCDPSVDRRVGKAHLHGLPRGTGASGGFVHTAQSHLLQVPVPLPSKASVAAVLTGWVCSLPASFPPSSPRVDTDGEEV